MAMINLDEVIDAAECLDGFCISCGFRQGGCEPDASRYTCEDCGKPTVYGAEEIIMMGLAE